MTHDLPSDTIAQALVTSELASRKVSVDGEVLAGTSERFTALLISGRSRYGHLIRVARIKPD